MSKTKKSPDYAVSFLTRQIATGTTASSYLLTGGGDEKKKDLALAFAKALNCAEKNFFEACNCTHCSRISAGAHPDVRVYGADEDAASIKIGEMRDLQNWLNLKPFEGRAKVFILYRAGRLTLDAQNALLKSLEEPPPESVFLLLIDKKTDLLDTIVSRCAEIKVSPYREEELTTLLEKEGASPEEAVFLARMSCGNAAAARSGFEKGYFKKKNEFLNQAMQDTVNGFDQAAQKPRPVANDFLTLLSEWVRDACLLKHSQDPSLLIHEDRLEQLKQFSGSGSAEELSALFSHIEETRQALEENANQKLAFARLQIFWNQFLT